MKDDEKYIFFLNSDNEPISLKDVKVSKNNFLITAKHSLTSKSQKLLTACLAKINPFGPVPAMGATVTLSISEIREILGVSGNSLYERMKKTAKNIADNSFIFYEDEKNQSFGFTALVQSCKFSNQELTVTFGKDATPFLYEIQKSNQGFTTYRLANILGLRSSYSIRLYELFSKHMYKISKNRPSIDLAYELEELKTLLGVYNLNDPRAAEAKDLMEKGITDYKKIISKIKFNDLDYKRPYPYYANFRQKVLNVAKNELSKKTDICFDFTEVRSGNNVTQIIFHISKNTQNSQNNKEMKEKYDFLRKTLNTMPESSDKQDIIIEYIMEMIEEPRVKLTEARKIAEAAQYDLALINHAYRMALESKTKINNIVGWMISCIEKEWGIDPENKAEDYTKLAPEMEILEWDDVVQGTPDLQFASLNQEQQRVLQTPIKELNITSAAIRNLEEADLKTLYDIYQLNKKELLQIRMVGAKVVEKINEYLTSIGLEIREA